MFDRINEGRWWDKAWSLVDGCTPCSPGCDHCWLRSIDRRFKKISSRVTFRADRLNVPKRRRKPTAFAVWSDLFHGSNPPDQIEAAMEYMRDCPHHVFLALTKRPENVLRFWKWRKDVWLAPNRVSVWPDNCWLGTTVCNQTESDEKIPYLLRVPAAVRFLSVEPMLGPVDLLHLQPGDPPTEIDALSGTHGVIRPHGGNCDKIDWVICGGESGPGARPVHPDWARSLRDQCVGTGVPFFFKQWGGVNKKRAGITLDGREWLQMPDGLR